MRIGELLRMSVLDADIGNRTVRVSGKGNKERIVPMGRHAAFWLGKYLSAARKEHFRDDGGSIRENRLWVNANGGRLDRNAVSVMLAARCRAAGVRRTSPHAIRRACATHMLRNGAHPVQLQMLLGHADLRTLGHYLRLTIADIKDMHKRSRPGA
jgi:integrase/recombinase XerC